MNRPLTLAAIRMDAAPAPTASRLERADKLLVQAAAQGVQIAVLPEVFNTGYEYHPRNYGLAESIDGQSVAWMKASARQHNLYLAGSLLLRENGDIYNSMLLVAPDGQTWRYEKSYPWALERAYFRPRKHPIQPAETELGKIGMMICWDCGHPELWAAYASKVDLMLVSSCPPLLNEVHYRLPDGKSVQPRELGPLLGQTYRNADKIYGEFARQQSAWLGVPLVHTTGGGHFRSGLPRPKLALGIFFAARPDLWKYIRRAEQVWMECGYFDETFIADARGQVLSRTQIDRDDLTVSTVELAASAPTAPAQQPKIELSPLAYLADSLANRLLVSCYEKNK